ncbi:MAG TPA: hypothetical protein VF297_03480 [Pyrinomonadaceae bacterium]
MGQSERFEQAFWRDDNLPHLVVDTREATNRFGDVAWSPDDKMIAASTTGGVKVWTLHPAAHMRTFPVDAAWAEFSVFSPDGRLLAGASSDGTLTVWELSSGRRLWSRLAHSKRLATLGFDPESATIISVGYDSSVSIWRASSGKLARAVPVREQAVDACAISEDARAVALGGKDGITFIDISTGAQARCEIPAGVRVYSAVFAGARPILATSSSDGIVRLYTQGDKTQVRELSTLFSSPTEDKTVPRRDADKPPPKVHKTSRTGPDPIPLLAFGRDDSLLAGGTLDGSVAVWKTGSGALLDSLQAHTSHVYGVAFSHDGRMLATCGGMDRIVKIWRVGRRLKELVTLIALGDDQWAAMTPDERFDASSAGLDYMYWASGTRAPVPAKQMPEYPPDPTILPSLSSTRTRSRKQRTRPVSLPEPAESSNTPSMASSTPVLTVRTRPAHRVHSVAWSQDETLIAGGTEDGSIDIWDRATGRELRTLRSHDDAVTSLAFVGADVLASGARDGTVRVWNIRTGEPLHVFRVGMPGSGVSIASAVADGFLICVSYEGTIRWLHLGARARLHTARILLEQNGMTSLLREMVAVSPDGRIAVRPYHRGSVAVFDLSSNRLLYEFGSEDTPGAITFERSGNRFAVGGATTQGIVIIGGGEGARDGEHPSKTYAVDVRDTRRGTRRESRVGHRANVVALAFSPDGDSLVTGSLDGTARIWEKGTKNERVKLETGSDSVLAVAYNRDGSLLATGEGKGPFEGRINVWDTASGERAQTFERHIGDVHPVRFSPDGTLLAAAGEDGILRVWRLRLRTPPMLIKGHTGRIFSLAFSPDGQYIATASWDGTSRLWRTDTGEFVHMLDSREGVKVWSVAFNPDGLTLTTGCDDGSARVWEISSGNLLYTIEGARGGTR